ncbi:hypothetical protein H8959_015364, partial [Pygathrix nigripes]
DRGKAGYETTSSLKTDVHTDRINSLEGALCDSRKNTNHGQETQDLSQTQESSALGPATHHQPLISSSVKQRVVANELLLVFTFCISGSCSDLEESGRDHGETTGHLPGLFASEEQ